MAQNFVSARKADNLIMLVEDDKIVARLLSHTLMQRGFHVDLSTDGRQTIENLDNKQVPDLVLLDIILPLADGFEVLTHLTQNFLKICFGILKTTKYCGFTNKSRFINA